MASARTVLKFKNDMGEIGRLAEELEGFCERNAVSPGALMALNLALEEIVTNVISYGYEDGGSHEIDLELLLDNGMVQATVADDGKAYDPLQRQDPDVEAPLEERNIGGLGVLLVKRLMDDVTYARTDGRNVLTIRKRA
jgi:serine/threonine-protein kinase RsbW/sigma-B regulation protein RsbU (phosphoserine phosphatase)